MNFLLRRPRLIRHPLRIPQNPTSNFIRSYTSVVEEREASEAPREPRKPKVKPIPDSPSFYTTRPVYHDKVVYLERAIGRAYHLLRANHLLPLPAFARENLPPLVPVWKSQIEMASNFDTKMSTGRYRRVVKLLNQLNDYHRIATLGSCHILGEKIRSITSLFESNEKEAVLARGKRKKVQLDEHGRSYTFGKRKTSSARVWMIPVQVPKMEPTPDEMLGLDTDRIYPVTTTTILVNNLPINEYFALPADRERITRPLRVAGVLGKYNIFAIVRGGGTTGQSGALAHGISKGVVAHEPDFETLFRRGQLHHKYPRFLLLIITVKPAKLTRRDPRMVERKKTGLAKARKRVSPTNHFVINASSFLMSNSTPGSNVEKSGEFCCWISFLIILCPLVHVEFKNKKNRI